MKRLLEEELLQWKSRSDRLPLILRGARQVGKSYLVEHFARAHFDTFIAIDFELRPELKRCFEVRDPKSIVEQLEGIFHQPIVAGKTLLFFDEIQHCPDALVALRYFRELMPELHVIAAGSLMEFLLHDERYSFPVGRVEFLYLRPLSFYEFLLAVAPMLAERLEAATLASPPLPGIHDECLKWLRRYFYVGGMPAAVRSWLQHNSLLECQKVHTAILESYQNDCGKYASRMEHKYLYMMLSKTPALVGQLFAYSHVDRDIRSRDLQPALELLLRAGILHQIYSTTASGLPLHAHAREHRFKLAFLDIGLLQTACQVDAQALFHNELLQINAGQLAEQFVAQELFAITPPYLKRSLHFWESGGRSGEVDFVTTVDSKIIPIEVKAGSTGSMRSLHQFLTTRQAPLGVRVSEHSLALREGILSIPLYLTHALQRLVNEVALTEVPLIPPSSEP